MEWIYIVISVIVIIISVIIIVALSKKIKQLSIQLSKNIKELEEGYRQQILDACAAESAKLNTVATARKNEEAAYQQRRQSLQELIEQIELRRAEALKSDKEICERYFEGIFNTTKADYVHSINSTLKLLKEAAQEEYNSKTKEYEDALINLSIRVLEAQNEVEDWESRRDAINQDILRERQLNEQQDFYRVDLSEDALQDISVLLEAKSRLNSHSILDKLIYDGYVAKPVNEMIKRVLAGRAPCGIYKITRLKTKEVYVGQSTNIKNRWQEHCKSCFNVGTIARSILHTTMQLDGIENFAFEVIEECPKDKLTEREKFYINLYGSKKYGLNERL